MGLRAIRKRRIPEDIVAQIRRQLADGRLKPGELLPSERKLSETFEVSRASVREALRALESMGLVQSRSGNGTFIATSPAALLSPLTSDVLQHKDTLLEVFEVRKIIEPETASLAALRCSRHDLVRLERILVEQAAQIEAGGTGMEFDTAFHSLLASCAGNHLLLKLNDAIVDSLRVTRERSLQVDGRPAKSLDGHREILNAIRNRNPAEARLAMLKHLQSMETNVLASASRVGQAGAQSAAGRPQAA